jgi:RNA polymerase sigma factor (sigma-70 family)
MAAVRVGTRDARHPQIPGSIFCAGADICSQQVVPDDEPSLLPTRVSLLNRLKDWNDQAGWQEFFDTYWRLIYSVARKSGLTETEAQDIVQDTLVTVARHMPSFQYSPERGSFKSWLLSVVRSRIIDSRRKGAKLRDATVPLPEAETATGMARALPDTEAPELEGLWASEWEEHLLDRALRKVRTLVSTKQFLMYELHVLKESPIGDVAANLQVSSMSVYLAKHRVGKLVRSELSRLRAAEAHP